MSTEKRLTDSKEAMLIEGIGMLAFGAVAFCYPGRQLQAMLTPVGMLLFLNGIARLLLSAWFFPRGSSWRRLLQQSGWSDTLTGLIALFFVALNIEAAMKLFATWLILSGYFHTRRFDQLRSQWPGSRSLGIFGLLSILAGLLLWGNVILNWLAFNYLFPVTAIILGGSQIYAFIKLGKLQGRLSKNERDGLEQEQEQNHTLSKLNLN